MSGEARLGDICRFKTTLAGAAPLWSVQIWRPEQDIDSFRTFVFFVRLFRKFSSLRDPGNPGEAQATALQQWH
jgi:hypothetical protein